MDPVPFQELLRRVRAGESDAAAELVRRYEPELRRAVRMRLTDPRLRRKFDSGDICQSVLGNFFVRVVAGRFDLPGPGHLLRLLIRMAHNKLVDHARKPDHRKETEDTVGLNGAAGREVNPSDAAAEAELLRAVRAELTAAESRIAELRADGREWADIAAAVNTSPDAARKTLARAIERVCRRLGLEGISHD
jgi:RNA polymerase sigma-70 factor (ECF subfamily)